MTRRRVALGLAIVFLAALAFAFSRIPGRIAARRNAVEGTAIPVGERARALHRTLRVADLHADSLFWGRELLERSEVGHVDVPRLVDGNVTLQVFSTVITAVEDPSGWLGRRDRVTAFALADGWPPRTWNSLVERALYQARRFDDCVRRSGGVLVPVRTADDLERFLERRRDEPRIVAGLLALEGLQAIEGRIERVQALFDAGYRMMGLAHLHDTEVAGSLHGPEGGGLTALGREVIPRLEALGVLIDLSHASPRAVDEALDLATRPVVFSHGGVRGTCDRPRNVDDRQLDRLAANGGILGVGYWRGAVCGDDARAVARAIRYVADRIGVAHVALGSDFDGAVRTPFDTAGLAQLTQALLEEGFDDEAIRAIMGENVLGLLRRALPSEASDVAASPRPAVTR